MGGYAWVTLATNDSYSLGALVLAHSLRGVRTKHDLAVLVTPGVTATMREKLSAVFTLVQEVNVLDSKDAANLALLARPELGITFTKLHCWRLTQYEKCVFVDADALVIRNCDELFERDEFSAAPDVGWPDCFNSGVFVFRPSEETFASLTSFAAAKGSFDGGDQGLLNQYFSDWARGDIGKHLPFIYNMCSTATYSYLPAFKQYGGDVRIIHFIGSTKPWLQYFDTITGQVHPAPGTNHLQPLLQLWWNIFCDKVHPELSSVMASSTLAQDWHEYKYEPPSIFHDPLTMPSYHSTDYLSRDEIDDFSEFHDPWDNYRGTTDLTSKTSDIPMTNDNNYDDHPNSDNHREYIEVCSDLESLKIPPVLEITVSDVTKSNRVYSNHESTDHENQDSLSRNTPIQNKFEPTFGPRFEPRVVENDCNIENEELSKFHEDSKFDVKSNFVQEAKNDEPRSHVVRWTDQCAFDVSVVRTDSTNHAPLIPHTPCTGTNDRALTSPTPRADSSCASLPTPPVLPCTKSSSVTARSETNVTGQLESNYAGIAGALAKITLGEARSPEQIALEEHMRKQSWEQGQIDYMGRDSFDNIWKKISETLGKQPERQNSPPKDAPKSEDMEAKKSLAGPKEARPETETVAAALLELECKVDKEDQLIGELAREDDVRKLITPLSELSQGERSLPRTIAPLEEAKPAVAPIEEVKTTVVPTGEAKTTVVPTGETKTTVAPAGEVKTTMALLEEVKTEKMAENLAGRKDVADVESSEFPTESQVPIQVAESVLEADVKESVTEDLKPVTEEAVSSISLTAQESVPAVLETAMEAVDTIAPRPNGQEFSSEIGNGIDAFEIGPAGGLASATVAVVESISLPVEPRLPVAAKPEESESLQTPQESPTVTVPSTIPHPTATSQSRKDIEQPSIATSTVDSTSKTEKSEPAPCASAEVSVSTAVPLVTQSEPPSCPLKTTNKMEEPPVEAREAKTPKDSETALIGTAVSERTVDKEIPGVPVDKEVSTKSVDKEVSGKSADIKILTESIDKNISVDSVSEKKCEVSIGTKESKKEIGKKDSEVSVGKEDSAASVRKEEPVASADKEVIEKSIDKAVVAKPVDTDAHSKPADKDVPKKAIDKIIAQKPIDKESSGESSEASPSTDDSSPLRPARTKELQIPDTPTVIEATPPTSPPIGSVASLDDQQAANKSTKKVVKKVVKKTTETKSTPDPTADPETEVKKVTKKVVKKSPKKKEDDPSASTDTKKVVKTVKKTTTKTQQQTLDVAEATAPETPPPSAPEVPVPPKRKLKTTTKMTSQKSDSEP